jgi:hypothetical protein
MASSSGCGNLDDRARDMHIRMGVGMLSAGLLAAAVMHHLRWSGLASLALSPIFFVAVYGLAAGFGGTCVLNAISGKRRGTSGAEPIADRQELAAVRRRGASLTGASLLIAVAASALLAFAR